MSNFHILAQAEDEKTISVVFHYPVPGTNNQAGISFQTALVLYLGGAENIKSEVADAAELANIQAGAIYELRTSVRWSRLGLSNAQKLQEVKNAWAYELSNLNNYFSIVLAFEGYKGNV